MDVTAPALRERMVAVRFRRVELANEISAMAQRTANAAGEACAGVLSIVRKWRARQGSNLRPQA